MAERPKLSVKPAAPARDPWRRPVRGTAPRPPNGPKEPPRATEPARQTQPQAPREPRQEAPRERPRQADRPPSRERPPAENRPRDRDRQPERGQDRARPQPQDRAQARDPGREHPPARPPTRPSVPLAPSAQDAPQVRSAAPSAGPRPAPLHTAAPTTRAEPPASEQGVRLSKLISERGIASRREADDWIDAGWVRVDGAMAVLGQRVRPEQNIEIDPRATKQQAKQVTILLHKPIGYVSAQPEDGYQPAVVLVTAANRWSGDNSSFSYHPGQLRHLAPAGRLDIASPGLLVLTQDGRVAKLLIGDETRVEKEYLVRVRYQGEGDFPERSMRLLHHGLELDGVALRPARVSWQNEDQLRFVLREGKKRQIRRMCEAVGLEVLGLKRVRIGSVSLGNMPAGQWRYLDEGERFI